MELQHSFVVPASVDATWAMVNDLESVAPCFPGAALTSVQGDDFAGTVKVKLGPVSLQYSGTGTFVERDEATHTARFEAKGKDKRGNGTAAAKVRAVLTPDGTGTAVAVDTDLSVTGKPAQFGRGLMQDVSDKLLGQFVDCLTERLTGPAAADPAPEPAAGPPDQPATQPTTPPPPRPTEAPPSSQVALDLGATVLPVLARRYGPYALGGLVVLLVVRRLLRR
ncbi:MAG: SRPBCC family protein [Actinomycetota bacterium]|nr:SRPBCC family protein [Actinomycetota bacterium]